MVNVDKVVENYVAVWNESDADERRRKIRAVWAADGSTCFRLLDAHGYEEIEGRVRSSWEKWGQEGKYAFRPKFTSSHHNVVKFDFAAVAVSEGDRVEGNGLSFLILDSDGRIQDDFQFNPTANDANELAGLYVATLNETDPQIRRQRIMTLWAPDGTFMSERSVRKGYEEIEAETTEVHEAAAAKGLVFLPGDRFQQHHNVARLSWELRATDSATVAAAGSDLLVLDDRGRILFDYQFGVPA
jgi:hypothetical protein